MKSKMQWTRSETLPLAGLYALGLVWLIVLGVSCTAIPQSTARETMPTQNQQLIGTWEKVTDSACSRMYPSQLRFLEDGQYDAQNDPSSSFMIWDVGTYAIADSRQVQISLANDAAITYGFSVENDVLTFEDPDGCEFEYRRVG